MAKHDTRTEGASAAIVIDASIPLPDFRAAVTMAADLVENRNTYPALGCLLIEPERISYRGIDESFSRPVAGKGFGAVLVPKRALLGFLRGATGDAVTIRKAAEEDAVIFSDGTGFVVSAVPMDPAQVLEDMARKMPMDAPTFALAEGVLAHLFKLTMPFLSTEETRYYLNGVCLEIEDEGYTLRAVATDGHRMGSRSTKLPAQFKKTVGSTLRYIVPRAAVTFLARHMAALEVRASLKDTHAVFHAGGMTFTTKLIDGTFPDWRRVVPDYADAGVVEIETKSASRFLSAASAMRARSGRFGQRALRVYADHGRPMFEVKDVDSGTMVAPIPGTLPNTINGPFKTHGSDKEIATDFGVNAAYLAGILKTLGAKTTRLLVRSAGEPLRITADAEVDGLKSDIVILMPMRV